MDRTVSVLACLEDAYLVGSPGAVTVGPLGFHSRDAALGPCGAPGEDAGVDADDAPSGAANVPAGVLTRVAAEELLDPGQFRKFRVSVEVPPPLRNPLPPVPPDAPDHSATAGDLYGRLAFLATYIAARTDGRRFESRQFRPTSVRPQCDQHTAAREVRMFSQGDP